MDAVGAPELATGQRQWHTPLGSTRERACRGPQRVLVVFRMTACGLGPCSRNFWLSGLQIDSLVLARTVTPVGLVVVAMHGGCWDARLLKCHTTTLDAVEWSFFPVLRQGLGLGQGEAPLLLRTCFEPTDAVELCPFTSRSRWTTSG